jgi:hypothetical protein
MMLLSAVFVDIDLIFKKRYRKPPLIATKWPLPQRRSRLCPPITVLRSEIALGLIALESLLAAVPRKNGVYFLGV